MSNYLSGEQWLEVFDAISEYVTTSTQRKEVIRTFLPDMLDTGYSGQQALSLFQQSGLGVSYSTFYSIRRSILDDPNLTSALRTLGNDEEIAENLLRISSRELNQKYRIVAAYAIENSDTGDVRYGEWAYDVNQLGEKGDILNQIIEDITARYPLGNFDTLTANLRRGYIDLGKE